jgi:hypothetical protein
MLALGIWVIIHQPAGATTGATSRGNQQGQPAGATSRGNQRSNHPCIYPILSKALPIIFLYIHTVLQKEFLSIIQPIESQVYQYTELALPALSFYSAYYSMNQPCLTQCSVANPVVECRVAFAPVFFSAKLHQFCLIHLHLSFLAQSCISSV